MATTTLQDNFYTFQNNDVTFHNSTVTEAVMTSQSRDDITPRPYNAYYDIGLGLQMYMLPVLGPPGLVGNILTVLVMAMKKNKNISCCIYMAGLAIADNITVLAVMYYWYLTTIKKAATDLECQLEIYFAHVGTFAGVLLLTAMSADRYMAVRHPVESMKLRTRKRALQVSTIFFIISVVYNIPYGITTRQLYGKICTAFVTDDIWSRIYSYINISVNSLLPFLLLMYFNLSILAVVQQRRRKKPIQVVAPAPGSSNMTMDQPNQNEGVGHNIDNRLQAPSNNQVRNDVTPAQVSQPNASNQNSREIQLATMLIFVTFAFLLLTMPIYVRYVLLMCFDCKSSLEIDAVCFLFINITNRLYYANNMVNFYMYILSSNKFRKDTAELLGLPKCNNHVSPLNINGN